MARPVASISGVLLTVFVCAVSLRAAPATAEKWIEVRSPHFVVVSNAGEKQARQAADQFEQFRVVFQTALPKVRLDPGQPVIIFAVKNEKNLKDLLPQYWERKGSAHPAGVFVPGRDKHYVALRLDAGDEEDRFHIVYHEYVHVLVNLNFEWIPLWLNEGLAEFYANARVTNKEALVGRPSEYHLDLLKQSKLLSMDALLAADHNSPYYNEANRVNVFYAESWALTHYLILDARKGHQKELLDYMALIAQGASTADAFRKVFGDPKQFQKTFDAYMRQETFFAARINLPVSAEPKTFAVRELSPAEASAARGDFHVHMRRPAEARVLLEEAMSLDPALAAPRESMGLLELQEGQRDEATKWFSEAVHLDSRNFLAYYYNAFLSSQGLLGPERMAATEQNLKKAIELNPNFAPAYTVLAQLYVVRGENLDDAMAAARKAVQLEPGNLSHHLAVANVLMRMERIADAQTLVERVLAAAKKLEDRMEAEQFLQVLRGYQDQLAERKRMEEEFKRMQDERRKAAAEAAKRNEEAPSSPAGSGAPSGPAAKARRITAPGEGRVSTISCSGKTLDLTLEYYGIKTTLHSEDLWKIEYTTYGQMPKDFNPCTYLKGRNVKVEYTVKTGGTYAGELVSVEIQK